MAIKIYNTLTRTKEDFLPLREGEVGMYVCGPTVYDEPHIGHARSAYAFDVIRRYFKYKGYKATFVRNVTDVDDKIINKAKDEFLGEDLTIAVKKVSEKYLKTYHDYVEKLGIMPPDKEPKATDYINKMKDFINMLIERDVAYQSGGDVYFSVRKALEYGKLSNQSFDMLESGARVASGENKLDPHDFALWKSAKEGEPSWPSPWGEGRPGWHIECSAMSSDILGDEFDIHGGGIDLVFPHHENERAQSLGAGKKFARYWIHNGLLTINKEKMSKSLGNFITIKEILDKYPSDVLKILFLQTHYSHPVDFSWERMDEAKKAYDRIIILIDKINRFKGKGLRVKGNANKTDISEFRNKFQEAMDDDFNSPKGLAVLFDLVSASNKLLENNSEENIPSLEASLNLIKEIGNVLGLSFANNKTDFLELDIDKLIKERLEARKVKDFKKADAIRKSLESKGIILEDTKDGTTWRAK